MPIRHGHRVVAARRRATARPAAPDVGARDPAHVLYDHACELLLAAQGLRADSGADGTEPAIAATLGCLEASLDALGSAVDRMGTQTADRLRSMPTMLRHDARPTPADAERRFDELARSLRACRDAAGQVRARIGPAAGGEAGR